MPNIIKITEFDKLKNGTILAYQNKRNREPEYEAVDYLTDRSSVLSKINQYASDLDKIRREMDFSYFLINNLPPSDYLDGLDIKLEDYILYHQGYFLELVHQMKDKLIRLIDALSKININKYKEPEKIKINKVLSSSKIERHSKLVELLNEWGQESGSPISIVLKKRTNNHHFRSNLHLNSDYQDIKISKIFIDLQAQQSILTDYGLEQMKSRGEEGFNKWHKDTSDKIYKTKEYINNNLNNISKSLRLIFNLPSLTNKTGLRIAKVSYNNRSYREIKNKTSLDKIERTGVFGATIKIIQLALSKFIGDNIESIYVVGSVANGNPVFGSSDINLVIVLKYDTPGLKEKINKGISNSQLKVWSSVMIDVNVEVFTKEEFLSLDNFKILYSCKYNGVLIEGVDLARHKKCPLPGLGLAYLLNRGYKNEVLLIKDYLQNCTDLEDNEVILLARKVIKNTLWCLIGEVMSNHSIFSMDRKKKIEILIWAHPENKKMIYTSLRFLAPYASTSRESLLAIIDYLCIEKTFPLLDQLEEKSFNWYKDWSKNY